MSVRSDLRVEAMIRDNGRCQWPPSCQLLPSRLEMAHVIPAGSGGEDSLSNVVMLCKFHHDLHDGRVGRVLREYRWLLRDWLALKYGYER